MRRGGGGGGGESEDIYNHFYTIFVSSHMYPEKSEGTLLGIELTTSSVPIPLGR